MIKKKILDNLKKIVIIITCIMTVVSIMPKKVEALPKLLTKKIDSVEVLSTVGKVSAPLSTIGSGLVADALSLLLALLDGIMRIGDVYLAGNNEPSWYEAYFLNDDYYSEGFFEHVKDIFKTIKDNRKYIVFNYSVTPYKLFTSGTYKEVDDHYEVNMGIIDVNFFAEKDIQSINNKTIVASSILAPAIGSVYYGLRNLAMVLMMLVLVYIGIKILISSISEDQAKYKRMLVDWVVGLCLLFIMHYIMTAIVNLNSTVIDLIKNDEGDSYYICSDTLLEPWEEATATEMERERTVNLDFNTLFDANNDYAVDLNEGNNRNFLNQKLDMKKWGNNGVVKPNAFWVLNPEEGEFTANSIYRLNTMSYVRSIAGSAIEEPDSVYIVGYNNFNQATTIDQMGYTILFLVLVLETIMFIIIYVKRVIQLAFLTMIAPLVAFMYPLDKIGDGKAQSFNQWFKDYLFGVLIQPMHLLLYTIFIYAAGQLFRKNIIYAIAIYAYMIVAEKYIKKILGFEKASSGAATGLLGGALGAGLAMGGLNKFAGIGPGGHGSKPGSGKDGNKPKTHKIRKLSPSGSSGGPPASSGNRHSSEGASGGGSSTSNSTSSRPNASAPNASSNKKVGKLGSASKVLGRRINRALTGGEYTSKAPGYTRAVVGNLLGKGIRGGARIAGAIGMGGAGLVIGTASAIVNGNAGDIVKGALIGAKAGDKWFGAAGSTITNIGSGISNFADEVDAERAKTDDDVAKRLRERDALVQFQDDLADCTDDDRKKYENAIKQMSPYTNFKTFDEVKAASEAIKIAEANGQGNDDEAILKMYDDSKKWNGMETDVKMQETYKQSIDDEVRQQLGGVGNQEIVNNLNYEKRKNENEKEKLEKEIRLNGSTTARENELNRINAELTRINNDLNNANRIEAPIEAEKQRRMNATINISNKLG